MKEIELAHALTLSHVPRWVIVDTVKKQSVADHTIRTLYFAVEIAHRIHRTYTIMSIDIPRLALIAAFHDVTESTTGDVPTPFKRKLEADQNVIWPDKGSKADGIEGAIVNMADAVEALTFLRRYGVFPSGQVVRDLNIHVASALLRLQEEAVRTYSVRMPGMDQGLLLATMGKRLDDIVADVIAIGVSYE